MNTISHLSFSRCSALTVMLLLAVNFSITAQDSSFKDALSEYQNENFAKAAVAFDQIHSDRALLFAGKSYYNLHDYDTALERLLLVQDRNNDQLYGEAGYTLSLIYTKELDFTKALQQLWEVKKMKAYTQLSASSQELYDNILSYLNFEQRLDIMEESSRDSLLYDLSRTAMGRVNFDEAQILFTKMRKNVDEISSSRIDSLERVLENEGQYEELNKNTDLKPLPGLSYNIGIALPTYDSDKSEYRVARGLYKGAMLAAENFNKQHEMNIRFSFQSTGTNADSARQALESLADMGVDAIIGPLFSKQAQQMSRMADQFQTPIVAPLANDQNIADQSEYVYQINPTYQVHGKVMAKFASQLLENNRIAVLAQQNKAGNSASESFRNKIKEEGGEISSYFVKNMGPDGYQLSSYVRYITENSDSSASAIYAPFGGNNTSTLIDLLLRQLSTLDSDIVPIFGLPEISNANINPDYLKSRDIYFTESFYTKPSDHNIDRFKSSYKKRFHEAPNRFALIGYDTASYLFGTLDRIVNPARLQQQLPEQSLYNGLITNIHFDGHNVNQTLMVFKITKNGAVLVSE